MNCRVNNRWSFVWFPEFLSFVFPLVRPLILCSPRKPFPVLSITERKMKSRELPVRNAVLRPMKGRNPISFSEVFTSIDKTYFFPVLLSIDFFVSLVYFYTDFIFGKDILKTGNCTIWSSPRDCLKPEIQIWKKIFSHQLKIKFPMFHFYYNITQICLQTVA